MKTPKIGDTIKVYVTDDGYVSALPTDIHIEATVFSMYGPSSNNFAIAWKYRPSPISLQMTDKRGADFIYTAWVSPLSIVVPLSNNKCYCCRIPAPHSKEIEGYICPTCDAVNRLAL